MTTKKDDAINSILTDFEDFANLVLHQLDLLEKLFHQVKRKSRKNISNEILDNEKKLDKYEVKMSDKIVNTIVLYQPVASDIRKLLPVTGSLSALKGLVIW